MVTANQIAMRYGSRVLFENINLTLDRGKRYGLIGANGAGKTTFLKILTSEIEPSGGNVHIDPNARAGVLDQNQFAYENMTLTDAVLLGNKRLFDAIKEKEQIYAGGNFDDEKIAARLADLESITVEEDPTYEADVRIAKILSELGFPENAHAKKMSEITSADKFKILIAKALFPKPDVLFLDEPTNNLDLPTISWLEEQLNRHEGTLLVISHDRHFLNAVCTNMLDVDYKTIREFAGNYDDWYIASTILTRQAELEREKKLKEKAELEKFIARFSANASKARQATSRQKQLDKLNVESIKPSSRRDPSIVFKPNRKIGNEALKVENIAKSYGDHKVFENLSFAFEPGDKVALIGANGAGKTTFCKILMGELKPDKGVVKWGETVQNGYFPQDATDRISGDMTLYEWLRAFDKRAELAAIRNCLGRMLFSGEEQEKPVGKTSGGEKHRMMLSKLMLEGGNFLVLDEPTNHLDLEAIVALGEALYQFEGNIICVAHDRELIDAFANRIIMFGADGNTIDFKGTYEEFQISLVQD
ncbi:MAG: ATP-binding cassette domain-containing protein [Helicobacteraceae bacterium]|jgi:ATPase subunit of ABC transporter with duplicated ATPase domains|nr:ATP-binding cassette domain-containing protein [Helicobacteraceae bacterium]